MTTNAEESLGLSQRECANSVCRLLQARKTQGNTVSVCVQHVTSMICRVLHHSVERNKEHQQPLLYGLTGSFDSTVMMLCVYVPVLLEHNMFIPANSLMDANIVRGSQTHRPHLLGHSHMQS